MIIEKSTETITFDSRVVSADGRYARILHKNTTEEERAQIIEAVKQYEESSKGVLFARLIETGVLKKVLTPKARFKEVERSQTLRER